MSNYLRHCGPRLTGGFAICEANLGVGHQQGPTPGLLGEASGGADPIDGLVSSGNEFRLVTEIVYRTHKIYIKTVNTHAEYDKERWK